MQETEVQMGFSEGIFMELGGGVDDVSRWCRDGAYVEFGFR